MAATLAQAACVGAPAAGGDGAWASSEQETVVDNALTSNALTSNALTSNALTSNALTSNALTSNALTSNALTSNALTDPNARLVLQYIVGCALPAGAHLEIEIGGVTYGYDGQIGLAPAWGESGGSCGGGCKAWVSACVLSRVNHEGVAVPISLRGHQDALGTTSAERDVFDAREAAYYGDIFSVPQRRYACLSPGETSLPRVCGDSLVGCVMNVVGSCDDACKSEEEDEGACDDGDEDCASAYFVGCRDAVRNASGAFPAGTKKYNSTVTVFLQ